MDMMTCMAVLKAAALTLQYLLHNVYTGTVHEKNRPSKWLLVKDMKMQFQDVFRIKLSSNLPKSVIIILSVVLNFFSHFLIVHHNHKMYL